MAMPIGREESKEKTPLKKEGESGGVQPTSPRHFFWGKEKKRGQPVTSSCYWVKGKFGGVNFKKEKEKNSQKQQRGGENRTRAEGKRHASPYSNFLGKK